MCVNTNINIFILIVGSRSFDDNSWILTPKFVKREIVGKPAFVEGYMVKIKASCFFFPVLETQYLEVWVVTCKSSHYVFISKTDIHLF